MFCVLLRISVECIFTVLAAKVVSLTLILRSALGTFGINFHTAHGISISVCHLRLLVDFSEEILVDESVCAVFGVSHFCHFQIRGAETKHHITRDGYEDLGVFVGMNVMSALDAFSSPPGPDPLDGVTVRAVAQSVLSLATNRPLPDQGWGIRRLYLVFDLVLLILTALLVISLVRTRTWYRRLRERGVAEWSSFVWRGVLIAITHLTVPLLLLVVMTKVFFWKVLVMLQPDLGYWLQAVAVVLLVKGLVQIALISSVFRGSRARA